MMNLKFNKILFLVSILCNLLVAGCQSTSAKKLHLAQSENSIENILRDAIAGNKKLVNSKTNNKVPEKIVATLVPASILAPPKNQQAVARFDIAANEMPVRDFFLSLIDGTDYNLVVHPDLQGSVTLNLKNVTIGQVLTTVQNLYDYHYKGTGKNIQIMTAALQTRSYTINYLDLDRTGKSDTRVESGSESVGGTSNSSGDSGSDSSSDSGSSQSLKSQITTKSQTNFWANLQANIEIIIGRGEGRHVAISPMTGLIVVQAMPRELDLVDKFIKSSELSLTRQVILEAKILEVELSDGFQAGINWALLSGKVSAKQLGSSVLGSTIDVPGMPSSIATSNTTTNFNLNAGGETASLGSSGAFGGMFSLAFNYKNLAAFVELLSSQGKVKVLSSPRVSTTNNQKALIKIGVDKAFITNITTTTNIGSGTTSTQTPTVELETFFSGIALDVTPQISDGGDIILHVHPTISTVKEEDKKFKIGGVDQTIPLAVSSIRESDSIVRAKSGQVVVIGGLMQERSSELVVGVPGLKNIPLLGGLFRHKRQQVKKSELVILLRPIIVDDGRWVDALHKTADSFKQLKEDFEMGNGDGFIG